MKNTFLLLITTCFSVLLYAQSEVEQLVRKGVELHDAGDYDAAINTYKQALKLDPDSELTHYEMAMTYMSMQEYEKSIKHSDYVIKAKGTYVLHAYLTKGSCLDYLGKTEESVKLFEKGLKEFGDNHLLYYNLAFNYYKLQEFDEAEKALIKGIEIKSDHPSSHLLLGFLMSEQRRTSESLMPLYYFLLLEPDSKRSVKAYALIMDQFGGKVKSDEPGKISIYMNPDQMDGEFGAADLMVSMLQASDHLEENEGKSQEELFIDKTTSFFTVLGELKDDKSKGLWWELYVPFFYDLSTSDHMNAFCYYITQTSEVSSDWIKDHMEDLKAFAGWLDEK